MSERCSMKQCSQCGKKLEYEDPATYKGMVFCEACAHNMTHIRQLQEGDMPCPVYDGEKGKELIPFGTYPNIDWS